MRLVAVVSLVVASLALSSAGGARAPVSEPFVAAGVWYPHGLSKGAPAAPPLGESGQDRDRWQRDLTAIKAAGFNSIRTVVDWANAEPEHGRYQFDRFGALLKVADAAGLSVIVQVDARAAPGWLWRRHQDAGVQPEPGGRVSPPSNGYCMDHPGVRADLGAFIGATASFAAGHPAFYAIDVWRNPGASSNNTAPFCYCPYTQARFRDALLRKYRGVEALNAAWGQSFREWNVVRAPRVSGRDTPAFLDWTHFLAVKLQEDLKFRADASAPRGARLVVSHADDGGRSGVDDWLMTAVVDHYGSAIPWSGIGARSEPAGVMASLDLMRSSSRDKPWWLGAVHVDDGNGPAASEADLRLSAWAAVSRGAGTITFDDWPALNGGASADALGPARARAAGGVAGVVGRNSSLFGPLRPHRSRVAILHHPDLRSGPVSATPSGTSERDVYAAFFDLNIQADFIHPDEVVAGLATRYDILYAGDVGSSSTAVAEALKAFVRGGGTLIAESSARSVPQGRGAAQSLSEIFVTGARPLGGASSGAPETTAAAGRVGRRRDPVVTAAIYGGGRTFLIRPRSSLRTRRADGGGAGESLPRVIAAAGARPEIKIDGAGGLVEARFLESADAMVVIAMNYAATPRTVTFTFGPDVPEAIWQNMESGAAVNFVQGADGPIYTRTFAGRDAMVLVRGKRLR